MRILTDSAVYRSDYGPKKKSGIVPGNFAEVLYKSVDLLRNRIVQSGWMEPLVEFVEFKFEQATNIAGTFIVVKSVVSIENETLGKIKKECDAHFFDVLRLLPQSTAEEAAEKVAREVFEKISDMFSKIKNECDAVSRSIRMVGTGSKVKG